MDHKSRCLNGQWCCPDHERMFEQAAAAGEVSLQWAPDVPPKAIVEILDILDCRKGGGEEGGRET